VGGHPTHAADQGGRCRGHCGFSGRTYDISPDGQRFLLIKESGGPERAAAPFTLIVVQHFDEELKAVGEHQVGASFPWRVRRCPGNTQSD
jgi:hypothetical protein